MVTTHIASDEISRDDIARVNDLIAEVLLEGGKERFLDSFVRWKQATNRLLELEEKAVLAANGAPEKLYIVSAAYELLAASARLRIWLTGLKAEDQRSLADFDITLELIQSYERELVSLARVLDTKTEQELAEQAALLERIFGGTP